MPEPLSDNTSKERIYTELRRAIIMGHLEPDARLSVQELAEKYNNSVTPVRDALHMLGQEGLVTIKPRSGYFVTSMTLKQLRDILELREILEVAAVERAAARIDEPQLDQLAHVHAGYTGDDDESYDRYTDENRRYHRLVAEAAGNEELAAMLTQVHDRLARFMVMRHAGKTQPDTHAHITEALRAHDVGGARQAMLDEIKETRAALLDQVVTREGKSWKIS
jgi:DNA-binding GntR family transcriptional regulator